MLLIRLGGSEMVFWLETDFHDSHYLFLDFYTTDLRSLLHTKRNFSYCLWVCESDMFLGGNFSHNLSSAIAAFMFVKSLFTSRRNIERIVSPNRYLIGFLSDLEFAGFTVVFSFWSSDTTFYTILVVPTSNCIVYLSFPSKL